MLSIMRSWGGRRAKVRLTKRACMQFVLPGFVFGDFVDPGRRKVLNQTVTYLPLSSICTLRWRSLSCIQKQKDRSPSLHIILYTLPILSIHPIPRQLMIPALLFQVRPQASELLYSAPLRMDGRSSISICANPPCNLLCS